MARDSFAIWSACAGLACGSPQTAIYRITNGFDFFDNEFNRFLIERTKEIIQHTQYRDGRDSARHFGKADNIREEHADAGKRVSNVPAPFFSRLAMGSGSTLSSS